MATDEGVIQFTLDHAPGPPLATAEVKDLAAWRRILFLLGLIGQDPTRYGGFGFGNISRRTPEAERGFIVSGSQTGHLPELDGRHWAVVSDWDIAGNRVTAHGPVRPSSESLVHAALYDQRPAIGAVIHVHSPLIWRRGLRDGRPATPPEAAHGTVAMAAAAGDLLRRSDPGASGLFVMAGHEDGVIAFGDHLTAAGLLLVETLRGLQYHPDGLRAIHPRERSPGDPGRA